MKTQGQVNRRYLLELGLSLGAYVIVLFGSISFGSHLGANPNRLVLAALALAPMIPVIFACMAIVRYLRDCDELERQIQLQSLAVTVMVTAFVTFSYGFLEGVGFPRLSMFSVWPLMAIVWVVSKFAYTRALQ